jgi:hypothetical protein
MNAKADKSIATFDTTIVLRLYLAINVHSWLKSFSLNAMLFFWSHR